MRSERYFLGERNTPVQQGHIQLINRDNEELYSDVYNVYILL